VVATPPAGTTPTVEKGGLAELYDDLSRPNSPARSAGAKRITVYLVPSAAEAEALAVARAAARGTNGAPEDEIVLPVGTTEEQARANAFLRDLELHSADGNQLVVDVRRWL
jgi:hypothetical protein